MGWLEAFVWFCVCQSMEQEEGRRAGLPDTSQRGGCLCFRNIHVDGKELSGPFMSLPDTGELSFDFSYRRTVPPGCFFILFYFSYRRTVPPGCFLFYFISPTDAQCRQVVRPPLLPSGASGPPRLVALALWLPRPVAEWRVGCSDFAEDFEMRWLVTESSRAPDQGMTGVLQQCWVWLCRDPVFARRP